jgi:hypothetical protein
MASLADSVRIPMAQAFYCEDCQCIGNVAIRCECGSQHGMAPLSSWLNREKKSPSEALAGLTSAISLLESVLTENPSLEIAS